MMSKTIPFRLFCCISTLSIAILVANPAYVWGRGGGDPYHTIIDQTQANHLNVLVSNTQTTTSARNFPYVGANPLPWAAINPNLYPVGAPAKKNPDLYVQVLLNNSDVQSSSITTATDNTCDQSNPAKCPKNSNSVPQTFVHRLGTYHSNGSVTALNNSALPPVPNGTEALNNLFTLKGQAFDVDRLRYVANRLWAHWKSDVVNNTPGGWETTFNYQPTGTMSFENFIYNIVNHHPMYGIVRVVIPTNDCGDMYFDTTQATTGVAGKEFAIGYNHTWNGSGTSGRTCDPSNIRYYQPKLWQYERKLNSAVQDSSGSGTLNMYGMVMFDFVNYQTYDPDDFYDAKQDYIDRYASVADHNTATAGLTNDLVIKNAIMPRVQGRSIALQDWDTLNVNAVDDMNGDGGADTPKVAKGYVSSKSVAFKASDISDAAVWEYWMRTAANDSTQRAAIISDLTGATPQYNVWTQKFNAGAARRSTYDGLFTGWPEQDQFHAYFPNGYERGWMIAFDALNMERLDKTVTGTDNGLAGAWWKHLPDDDTTNNLGGSHHNDGGTGGRDIAYPVFGIPADNLAITVDANGDGKATRMPFFFSSDWEDMPALVFAGGLLDVHGFMNVSGMMYTPDSCEMECHSSSEVPGKLGPEQYLSGSILVGKGIWLEDQNTGDNSMIALSYNYASFDSIRTGTATVTITTATNISELKGQ